MTEKPKLDYFIIDGKIVKRGDEGFEELEAKYAKPVDLYIKDDVKATNTVEKEGGNK